MLLKQARERITFLGGCLLWLAQSTPSAAAADTEQRDFAILVDGKEAGQSRLNITVENDGAAVITANARVEVKQFLIHYSYSVESTEWWKEGKLTGLRSITTENGKRTELEATSDNNRLKVRVNGQERLASPEVWTSSFWKLAEARYHNKAVPVLEPDSGKEFTGQLQYVGTEQLTLLSQVQSCYHFRITGGDYPIDVWFDRYHRLVRQEFIDSGHKTIMQLIALRR
jgi:hypothetical protein